MVVEYWDVFCEYEFLQPIREILFQIITVNHPPICYKPPRKVLREYEVMGNLVERLDGNGVVEEGNGPQGAFVVLTEKPHQENVLWHEYQWRLCVSYQKLN